VGYLTWFLELEPLVRGWIIVAVAAVIAIAWCHVPEIMLRRRLHRHMRRGK
jgi:hypothetical protein